MSIYEKEVATLASCAEPTSMTREGDRLLVGDESAGPVLECRSVERRFGGIVALNGIDMRIERGEIFGLVGPNGCGKTTLTNAITGFYPPQRGRILLNGRDITGLAPHFVATLGVARTFQNLALFNGMSVLDNILLGRHIHMKPSVARTALYWWLARNDETSNRAAVEDVIDFLQLEGVRDELVDGIPIGLKKRVELARALAAEPSFLILDEPMAGMNQEEKEYMARFILDARDERNVTVLLIEHHMDVVTGICDRMLALNYGAMIGSGVPADVVADPRVVEAYIGGAHAAR
jgi:branched-chain amino acid transport system ATP-binding protein